MDKKQTNPDFLETLDPAKASHNHIFIKTPTIVKDKQMDQLLENNLSSITNIVKRLVAKVEKEYGPPLKPYNWKTDWKSIIKDSLPQIRKSYIEASSVFSIAKPLPVDYRKVLYTLRKISFPLIKSPRGNFIAKTDEKWFASLLNEELKPIWRQEKTHKEWIDYFKKEYGWSKSRTSKFMSRKVSREIVPALFFELFPPNSSWGNIVKTCLKKDKLLKEVFKALPWDFLNNITYSYRNRLNTIRETIKTTRIDNCSVASKAFELREQK